MDDRVKRESVSRTGATPKTDIGTIVLHWVVALAFIVSLFTGVRIAADALIAPVSHWLVPILPQGDMWYWHFYSGLVLFFGASAYVLYVLRSGLIQRNAVKKTRVLAMKSAAPNEMGRGQRHPALVRLRPDRAHVRDRDHALSRARRLVGLCALDRGLRRPDLHFRACRRALHGWRLVAAPAHLQSGASCHHQGRAAEAATDRFDRRHRRRRGHRRDRSEHPRSARRRPHFRAGAQARRRNGRRDLEKRRAGHGRNASGQQGCRR